MFVLVINGGWETVTDCKKNQQGTIHHMTNKSTSHDRKNKHKEYLWKYIYLYKLTFSHVFHHLYLGSLWQKGCGWSWVVWSKIK
jgi:hypothetical protein